MESSNFSENNCAICLGDFCTSTDKAFVVTKGIASLIEFCKIRGDTLLQDHLERQKKPEPVDSMLVHPKCRCAYVDSKPTKRSSDSAPQQSPKKSKLRSNRSTFK